MNQNCGFVMTITIDIPKNIEANLNQRAKDEHIDNVLVLKQLLREGTKSYLVYQYSSGRISKERQVELLDIDIYGVNELLEKYHVKSSISYERFTRGIEMAEKSSKYK